MIENKFQHAPYPEHPNRCQGVTAVGQCPYLAMEGVTYCPRHGGPSQQQAQNRESTRKYRLAQWQARVGEFADHDQAKSLREEIGILNLLLESLIDRCPSQDMLILNSSSISDMVMKLEKLVTSCHRLETSSGQLLDKAAAIQIGAKVVEIISRYVTDAEILDAIALEIATAIANPEG